MNNFDTTELNKFNQTDAWWDPEGDFKTLHAINPLRLNYILQHSGSLQDKRILDVGCGGGLLAESLAMHGANVTGVDLATDALNAAKAHAHMQKLTIDYQLMATETLAQTAAAQFDIVSCMEMLEHVPDPAAIVQACTTLCKPGGHLFFSTINRSAKAFLLAIVGAEYVLNLLPRGTHEYIKLIRPAELASWARINGLTVEDISGIRYNPFTSKHGINDDPSVNYLMYCRKTGEQ